VNDDRAFYLGERVYAAGHLEAYATYLEAIDDTHAFVQFPDHVEPTPVAITFLTHADKAVAS
jgi:hypothetical protein